MSGHGNGGSTLVEDKLRRISRTSTVLGIVVIAGMFVVIALLTFALLRANSALETTKRIVVQNCYNIEVNRNFYNDLDRLLTQAIRSAPPGTDLSLTRKLVDSARLASDSMIDTDCAEREG